MSAKTYAHARLALPRATSVYSQQHTVFRLPHWRPRQTVSLSSTVPAISSSFGTITYSIMIRKTTETQASIGTTNQGRAESTVQRSRRAQKRLSTTPNFKRYSVSLRRCFVSTDTVIFVIHGRDRMAHSQSYSYGESCETAYCGGHTLQ